MTSSGIAASPSTGVLQTTGDDNDLSQSAVSRFLNDAQLCDSVLSGMDSETIKSLQTDADLGDYVGEHLKQLQCEEFKKCQQEQEKKREFAKIIAEDIKKKIELIEIQQKKKKEKAEQLECEHKDAEEKKTFRTNRTGKNGK